MSFMTIKVPNIPSEGTVNSLRSESKNSKVTGDFRKSRGILILLDFALPFSLGSINFLPHQLRMKALLEAK